jgi:hypothetical protein
MKGHPRAGEPTYFVEKFLLSRMSMGMPISELKKYDSLVSPEAKAELPKHHTVRMGRHFKPVDEITLGVWSGKPYRSKLIMFWSGPIRAVDIVIQVRLYNSIKVCKVIPRGMWNTLDSINKVELAKNDGLTLEDFINWFKLPFGDHDAQILIWNPEINY